MNSGSLSDLDKEAAKFLDRDFVQCFAQLQHYDTQITDVCKFAFTAYATVLGGSLTLYKYGVDHGRDYRYPAAAILFVGLLIGLVLFCLVVRNRIYYVRVARYINQHRSFFLAMKPLGFQENTGMYTDPKSPMFFNWRSSQSLLLYVMAVLNGLLFTAFTFVVGNVAHPALLTCVVIVFVVGQLVAAISHLKRHQKRKVN